MAAAATLQRPSAAARAVLAVGSLLFLHAAYSAYEHVSIRKGLGLSQGTIPFDITAEAVIALLVVLAGVVGTAAPLRDITWGSENKRRTIAEVDARPSFVTFNHRGPQMFGTETS